MSSITRVGRFRARARRRTLGIGKAGELFRVCAACSLILVYASLPEARAAVAGDTHGASRAEVREDLARYRCAGYDPVADETSYPADIEAAQARLQKSGCLAMEAKSNKPAERRETDQK